MRKRLLVTGALALVAITVVVTAAAVAGSTPQLTEPRVIRVVERPVGVSFIDLGEEGDSQGDLLPFANPLYNATNSSRVGRDQGSCIRVLLGRSWECNWTTFLARGSITVQGPFNDASDSTLAITGGTGEFRNARGEVLMHARADGNFLFVFRLQP